MEGAEGAWRAGLFPMPGPFLLFLFFADANRKPSRSMPLAVIAAQVCLIVELVVPVGFSVCGRFCRVGCCWVFVRLGFVSIVAVCCPCGHSRILMAFGRGVGVGLSGCYCWCVCCWGPGVGRFLSPAIILFAICLSLVSKCSSISRMSASMAPWVIGLSSVCYEIPVPEGFVSVSLSFSGFVWVVSEEFDRSRPYISLLLLLLAGSGVKFSESVPGIVWGSVVCIWDENLTLLSLLGGWVGAWMLSLIPGLLVLCPSPSNMAVSWVLWVAGTSICGMVSMIGVAEWSIWSICCCAGDEDGSPIMDDSCERWMDEAITASVARAS